MAKEHPGGSAAPTPPPPPAPDAGGHRRARPPRRDHDPRRPSEPGVHRHPTDRRPDRRPRPARRRPPRPVLWPRRAAPRDRDPGWDTGPCPRELRSASDAPKMTAVPTAGAGVGSGGISQVGRATAPIFALSFISAMGLPVGAELALIYGGVLASGQAPREGQAAAARRRDPRRRRWVRSSVRWPATASGATAGRALVDKVGKYVLLTHKDLDRAEAWFARRGEPVVLFGRFIPLLRSFVSFAAGLGEMALAKFTIFTVIACAIWCTALCSLGYSLGAQLQARAQGVQLRGLRHRRCSPSSRSWCVFWHRLRSTVPARTGGTEV